MSCLKRPTGERPIVLSAGRGTSSTFETIRINFRFFVQRMKNCRTTPQRTSPRDSHLVELFERRGKKVWCLRRDEFVQCCGEPRPGTAKIDASTKIVESWASKTPEQKAARIFHGRAARPRVRLDFTYDTYLIECYVCTAKNYQHFSRYLGSLWRIPR